tara:strand:- start:18455 stop:18568 length:114 start_codon:yes stop_codon:yes gene_type:complete
MTKESNFIPAKPKKTKQGQGKHSTPKGDKKLRRGQGK